MKQILLPLFVICLATMALSAQSFSVSTSNAAYSELVDPVSLNNGMTWDDPEYLVPIGFDFTFMGNTISNFYFGGLGGTLFGDPSVSPIPALFAYGADIVDRGAGENIETDIPGSQSAISYKLEGAPGSRIFKLQWQNVGFYSDVSLNGDNNTDYVNFQFWVFEETNNFAIHHGPRSITNPELSFDQTPGTYMVFCPEFDFSLETIPANSIVVSGDPQDPTVEQFDAAFQITETLTIDGIIPEGTLYSFNQNSSVSIEEGTVDASLQLTPNPASSYFTLESTNPALLDQPVHIYTAIGQLVKTVNFNQQVDVSDLDRGLYFIEIGSSVERLILR